MMVPRVASDKPHDLIGAEEAFRPSLPDESLEISIHRGQAGPSFRHALPDLLHSQWAIRIPQYVEDALALGGLAHARGAEGRGDGGGRVGHGPRMAYRAPWMACSNAPGAGWARRIQAPLSCRFHSACSPALACWCCMPHSPGMSGPGGPGSPSI